MSDDSMPTVLEGDDDPLGGVVLESQVSFGVRAATLAGLTGPDGYRELLLSNTTCSITFIPPEPDQQ
jgi:hypothetical protein